MALATHGGTVEISRRLQDALIADLVADEDDEAELDRLTREPIDDVGEITGHLARQLGIHSQSGAAVAAAVHETLRLLVKELERMLAEWPLPEDSRAAAALAELACRNLQDHEVYSTLLAGPPRWLTADLTAGNLRKLDAQLRPILRKSLASSLNTMLTQWQTWDVPRLRTQWRKAKDERYAAAAAEKAALRRKLTPAEKEHKRRDDERLARAYYQPPGTTV